MPDARHTWWASTIERWVELRMYSAVLNVLVSLYVQQNETLKKLADEIEALKTQLARQQHGAKVTTHCGTYTRPHTPHTTHTHAHTG